MLAFLQSELVPSIPLAEWTESVVDWITDNFEWFFDPLDSVIDLVVGSLEYILLASPALLMVAILGVIAFLLASWRVALFTVLGLVFVISLDLWEAAMQTLALVLAATVVALVIGIPIGIIAAKSETVETIMRPILDVAQTMPAFVYLVPIVVLLGIGAGPALIADRKSTRLNSSHTVTYTLSLHDALPIYDHASHPRRRPDDAGLRVPGSHRCASGDRGRSGSDREDRKSTRLNSSHTV